MEEHKSSDGVATTEFKRLRNTIRAQQLEIAELKAMVNELGSELKISAETFSQLDECTHPSIECDAPAAAIMELLDKTPAQCLQSVKAEAVKTFGNEIGLYDSEYDDQEYIEVSRQSIVDHIEQLRENKS